MCNCKKNQTHENVFDFLKTENINLFKSKHLGIGIFLIPAPELGILEYKTVNVTDLSYRETVKRGENCKAFQWIPFGIEVKGTNKSYAIKSLKDFESIDIRCNDSCRGGCPFGCMCWVGEVICH